MKYLSLFSGIGGFEYGIQQSNKAKQLECIGYSEIDKYAKNVYEKHYPNHPRLGDATEIKTENLPTFDLLVGGFPCQAFSVAGKRRGFDDTRGTLFFEIARILKEKKPRYFLLENVKNLLSHDKGRTFQEMLRILSELGYDVLWEIFNSKDYGVPQNRERIYIKGFLREKCGQEILSISKFCTENNNRLITVKTNKSQGRRIYSVDGVSSTLGANGGGQGGKTGLYQIDEKRSIPCTLEGNFFALNTSPRWMPLKKKIDNYIFEENEDGDFEYKIRRLTPIECERLQGFPDEWTRYGSDGTEMSDTQRYKMCGNAVTTTVVQHIINTWDMGGLNQ